VRSGSRYGPCNRLQPHRLRTFKRSRNPAFAAKVEDVVGLYMTPPAHAVVLSIAAGARLFYLPAYSPDFNPITLVFSKLRTILRAMATRTISDLWDTIQRALRHFTSDECRRYLAAAGYDAYDPT